MPKKKHSVENISVHNYKKKKKFDLVVTFGVLIHINPKKLKQTYKKLLSLSSKYIYIEEYFSKNPTEIIYRNFSNVNFKRDFSKEILEVSNNRLKILDYGFHHSCDPFYHDAGVDDSNWFLFEKIN